MAFLDGVKGKISKAGYSTMQKAKDLSEITKLNMAVSESETKINEIYSEIGYKVYCAYRENPLEEVKEENLARSGSWKRLWKHANCRSRQSMQ